MNSSPPAPVDCRVVGGDKLPASSGGSDALCGAIAKAASTQNPSSRFSVEVQVLAASSLAATVTTAEGKVLPVQKYSISDRDFTPASFDRFAKVLVEAAMAGNR